MWVEWTMGRYGGIFGHHSTPGMFGRMTKSRWGTLVGSLGVSLPLLFAVYYTYIESWTFAYATFSASGAYSAPKDVDQKEAVLPEIVGVSRTELYALLGAKPSDKVIPESAAIDKASWPASAGDATFEQIDRDRDGRLTFAELSPILKPLNSFHTYRFLREYQGLAPGQPQHFGSLTTAIFFWLITVAINVWVLSRGISSGIEVLAKIAMPTLFVFAILLLISVLSFGTPDPSIPTRNVWAGLDFVWKPKFNALLDPEVWLVAAGQIFFTLSIGTGSIQAYSCYLNKDQDCAMTGLATVTTNEFAEVVLGGSIAIPIAVASFGLVATQAIAASGSFDLGFVAMPIIFEQMPFGRILGTMWFALLFFAGITSSVGLCQPVIAFMQEAYGWGRRASALLCGAALLILGLPVILYLGNGYLDEYDNWVGNVGLIVFGLIETIIFAWLFGYANMQEEMTRGQQLKVPALFYPTVRYIVPIFLITMLIAWGVSDFQKVVMLSEASSEDKPWMLLARGSIIVVMVAIAVLTMLSRPLRRASESNH
jgi:neurotransmitter:Na+ symporter, NSS family